MIAASLSNTGSEAARRRFAEEAAHANWEGTDRSAVDALMQRCALRDQRAFAELYRKTGPKMYALAVRIVGRADWAEDIVQESYFNIWTHIADYRASLGAPTTWMFAIVRNRALDWVRRPNFERSGENYEELLELIPDKGPDPGQLLETRRSARALNRCMRRLSSNERQAIELAYHFGLSHSELAQRLNQPVGSVKTWIRRGLQKLRRGMELESREQSEACNVGGGNG